MKQLTLLLLILVSSLRLLAQSKPLYIADTSVSISNPQGSQVPFAAYETNITQCIYYHSDFPGMPIQGQITDVYIRLSSSTPKGATLKGLTVKMKPTSVSSFSYNYYGANNIIETGLTTVFYDSNYVLKDSLAYGDWWRLPLPMPYTYSFVSGGDSARNLLVEFSVDTTIPSNNFNNFTYATNGNLNKWLSATRISNNLSCVTPSPCSMFIGINPKPDPVGVNEVSNTQLSLYPNPAKTTINFSLKGSYTISTLQGAIVQRGNGDAANIESLPQGLYIVQLTTKNGDRLEGRFLKE